MPDETPTAPSPAKPKPLEPGEFVTHVRGHPLKGDLPAEPLGRVVAIEPQVKVMTDAQGNPLLDKDGSARTQDDGVNVSVTWPILRQWSKHRPEQLARWDPK